MEAPEPPRARSRPHATPSALSCLALMASLAVETWLRFLVWLALGLVVYLVYGRKHSRLATGKAAPTNL